MKKQNNLKKYYSKFKVLWNIPKYRALIKLSLYGIMFLIIILIANTYTQNPNVNVEEKNEKTFTEILNSSNLENMKIDYTIKIYETEYILNGEINNNVLTGYLETDETIKKVKVENNIIYNIINNNELIDEALNNIIIKDFLFPKTIITLTNNYPAYIEKYENKTIYTYQINYNSTNYEIKLTTNLEQFTNININNNILEYNLNMDFDKNY